MAFTKKSDHDSGVSVKPGKKVESSAAKPVASPEPSDDGVKAEPTRSKRPRMSSIVNDDKNDVPAAPSKERGSRVAAKPKGEGAPVIAGLSQQKIMIIAVVAVALILIIWFITSQRSAPAPQPAANQPAVGEPQQPSEEPALSANEQLEQELNDQGYGIGSTGAGTGLGLVESDLMISDLEGQDMPEMFEAAAIAWISDFVSFTKHRALTGDGIELYWLEGLYKEQKCRIVVPYTYYKDLPDKGGVLCNIEIVETTNGNKIATFFQFDKNAYDKLTKD